MEMRIATYAASLLASDDVTARASAMCRHLAPASGKDVETSVKHDARRLCECVRDAIAQGATTYMELDVMLSTLLSEPSLMWEFDFHIY